MEKVIPENPEDELDKKKQVLLKKLKRRLKTAKKTVQKVDNQLQEALQWRQKERQAIVLQSNLYQVPKRTKEITLTDWETNTTITYTLNKEPQLEAALLFKRTKKLKQGIEPLKNQLNKAQQWQKKIEHAITQTEEATTPTTLEEITAPFNLTTPQRATEKPKPILPYREYTSSTGTPIWVGKNAKDNDTLTFSHANGSDTWLHVHEYPGSHVIIKSPNPDETTLQEAIQLAIKNSKAKNKGKVEVYITQRKYVSKFKSAKPGTVHISKHRSILAE